ncbi:hypothetical protein J4E85_005564 [Alternaria conjuncta]|uniref:uncharacterized protein n=1 Tax=Alternaria conjuncta TaxID=181017 RepID=UPI00221F6657|nr:uncharacterized protein J4E85_005564 [Alternaria conjuncta]KAI4928942.1 hypothetical protein J4E85_005564 [Alternaria conjuncta]
MLQTAPRDRISTDDLCKELALLLTAATEGISHLQTNSKDTDGAVLRALLKAEDVAQVQKSSEKSSHPLQQRIDVTGDATPLDPPERASVRFRKEENRKSRRLGQTLYRREILQSELGYATSNIVEKSEVFVKGDHGGATTESPLQEDSLSSFHTSSSISNGKSADFGSLGIRQGTNKDRSPISPYTLPGLPIRMNVESVHEMPLVSSPEIKVTEHPGSDAVSPHQITPPGGLRISEALTQFDHEQYAHGLTAGVQPIPSSVYDLPYDICHQRHHLEHGTRKGVFAKFKTKLGREDRKPDSDLAKTFDASRDLVLVIDNGASMFHHWSIVTFVAETLAKKAAGLDKDGIDVYFTVAGDEYNQKDLVGESGRQQLQTALSNATPDHVDREGCQTDMCDAFSKISHNWKEKGKPATTLLVLTDGIWKETNDVLFDQAVIKVAEDPIAATTKQTGKRLFSIQFIRFGEEGYERLRSLDDDLCKKHVGRDIVDHCSWRTSGTKMFKGSIEGYHDLDDADEQDMNYHYTELVGLFKRYNESNNAAESSAHLSPQSPTPSSLKRSWSRSSTSSDREKHQSAPATLLRKNSSHRRPFSQ